jgi:hypothetical protein
LLSQPNIHFTLSASTFASTHPIDAVYPTETIAVVKVVTSQEAAEREVFALESAHGQAFGEGR